MGVLAGMALVLTLAGCSGSRSHTLRYFYTAVWEAKQDAPWFTAVACLDGQLGGHYDSKTRRAVPRLLWMKKVEEEDPHFWDWNTERARSDELRFWRDMENLQKQYNQSGGLHTWQKMYGCEIREDGSKGGHDQYSYDGREFLSFDRETLTWTAADREAQLTKRTWEADLDRLRRNKLFLEEICIGLLQKFLEYGKEAFERKEQPTVKVTHSVGRSELLETLVCQAFGFYPKEINATWRRDGVIWHKETFRKSVAPNSDGTYHAWLSVQIDPKERGRYRCHVEHDSLAEPLDVGWDEKPATFPMGAILGGSAGCFPAGIGWIHHGNQSSEEEKENSSIRRKILGAGVGRTDDPCSLPQCTMREQSLQHDLLAIHQCNPRPDLGICSSSARSSLLFLKPSTFFQRCR